MKKGRRKPNRAQKSALRTLAQGKRLETQFGGRAAHGALAGTVATLRARGWIDQWGQITPAGREALGEVPA